ncbi:MAG: twin-arginine translocation signal domain-containing protein, partial [Candidatus Binatia bacterium]
MLNRRDFLKAAGLLA